MALARDASSLTVKSSGFIGTTPGSCTSDSFTPPAGSVVFVSSWTLGSFQNAASGSPAITDSGSHTWHLVANQPNDAITTAPSFRLAVWWTTVTTSAPMTVTVTDQTVSGQYIVVLDVAVDVFTGANTSNPLGASVTGVLSSSTTALVPVTPQASGSAILAAIQNTDTNDYITAGSGSFVYGSTVNHGMTEILAGSSATSFTPTTASAPVTLSAATSASAPWSYIAYEVLAASGGTSFTGTGSASVSLSASGSGSSRRTGAKTASLSLSASGSGSSRRTGAKTAPMGLSASGTGTSARSGTGTAVLSLSVTGTGSGTESASGTGSAVISLSAHGTGSSARSGSKSSLLSLAVAGTGRSSRSGTGYAVIRLSAAGHENSPELDPHLVSSVFTSLSPFSATIASGAYDGTIS